MKETIKNSIGFYAKRLGIPVTTLKYWERAGLVTFKRDENNDYRILTSNETHYFLACLNHFRRCGVPVKSLKNLQGANLTKLCEIVNKTADDITQQIEALEANLYALRNWQSKFRLLEHMRKQTFEFVELPFDRLIRYDNSKINHIHYEVANMDKISALYRFDSQGQISELIPAMNADPHDKKLNGDVVFVRNPEAKYIRFVSHSLTVDNSPKSDDSQLLLNKLIDCGFAPSQMIEQFFIMLFNQGGIEEYSLFYIETTANGTLPESVRN